MNRSRKEIENNFLPISPNPYSTMIHQKHFTLNILLLIGLLINWISPMMMHEHFPVVSSLMAEVMSVKLVSCR